MCDSSPGKFKRLPAIIGAIEILSQFMRHAPIRTGTVEIGLGRRQHNFLRAEEDLVIFEIVNLNWLVIVVELIAFFHELVDQISVSFVEILV